MLRAKKEEGLGIGGTLGGQGLSRCVGAHQKGVKRKKRAVAVGKGRPPQNGDWSPARRNITENKESFCAAQQRDRKTLSIEKHGKKGDGRREN